MTTSDEALKRVGVPLGMRTLLLKVPEELREYVYSLATLKQALYQEVWDAERRLWDVKQQLEAKPHCANLRETMMELEAEWLCSIEEACSKLRHDLYEDNLD